MEELDGHFMNAFFFPLGFGVTKTLPGVESAGATLALPIQWAILEKSALRSMVIGYAELDGSDRSRHASSPTIFWT